MILAAAGSAIGLGNIWKFPYIAGQYGGGAFVLMYMLFIDLILLPPGGATTAIFVGWVMKRSILANELSMDTGMFNLWRALIQIVVPVSVLVVLVSALT